MVGEKVTYATISRDRLVSLCESSSKADIFEKIVKQEPQATSERLRERLEGHGIDNADRILKDIDNYIEIHNAGLSSAMKILGM